MNAVNVEMNPQTMIRHTLVAIVWLLTAILNGAGVIAVYKLITLSIGRRKRIAKEIPE